MDNILIDGSNGTIGLLTTFALIWNKKNSIFNLYCLGTCTFEEYYAALLGRLYQYKDKYNKKHRIIKDKIISHQPHFLKLNELIVLSKNNILVKFDQNFTKIKYFQIDYNFSFKKRLQIAKENNCKIYVSNTGEYKDYKLLNKNIEQFNEIKLILSHPIKQKKTQELNLNKFNITATRNYSISGTRLRIVLDLDSDLDLDLNLFKKNVNEMIKINKFKDFIGLKKNISSAKEIIGSNKLLLIDSDEINIKNNKLFFVGWTDNEWGFSISHAKNILSVLNKSTSSQKFTKFLTNIYSVNGDDLINDFDFKVLSSSSCTTNSNILALTFLMNVIFNYIKKNILLKNNKFINKTIFDNLINFIDIHIEHSRTFSENINEINYLRACNSGSKIEVPLIFLDD